MQSRLLIARSRTKLSNVDEGKRLEDVFERLDFSLPEGSAHIDLKSELQNHLKGKPSCIASLTAHTRAFKPVELEVYPQELANK